MDNTIRNLTNFGFANVIVSYLIFTTILRNKLNCVYCTVIYM
jgi:uncharacterized membrane protein